MCLLNVCMYVCTVPVAHERDICERERVSAAAAAADSSYRLCTAAIAWIQVGFTGPLLPLDLLSSQPIPACPCIGESG